MLDLEKITKLVVNALEDIKGDDISIIDTQNLSPLFSKMIICTGNSNRQVKSLANNVIKELKEHHISIVGTEGETSGEWVLVDCGDIVIHVMLRQVRDYYDLESLWNGQRPTTKQV